MRLQRSLASAAHPLILARRFCTKPENILATVVFERLPVVVPKIDPVVYAFQEFSFRWRQQYRRKYPDEFLDKSDARGKGDYQIEYEPAPRITEADGSNNTKSLLRALDKRLYLILYGNAFGSTNKKPVWHFPEKIYEGEETLHKCAESVLQSVLGDLSHAYFVGNAPTGHMVMQPIDTAALDGSYKEPGISKKRLARRHGRWPQELQQFFFKSQVIGTKKFKIGKCDDYAWATKDELLEYFPEQAEYLNKMIMS